VVEYRDMVTIVRDRVRQLIKEGRTLAQIQAVADAGENMPQKSTHFWPKPASGLLMALQEPAKGPGAGLHQVA